jgi:hypothetical protein
MNFLAPIFLAGFAALAVPIIIHLWSKNTKTSIAFGSVRFLQETETRTMRSIMPSQWLLLLLRLLLISVLVFLLSGLVWDRDPKKVEKLYLIDRAYTDNTMVKALFDTLPESNKMQWLALGFPDYSELVTKDSASYWSLLRSEEMTNAENSIIVSPLLVMDFWGEKSVFPRAYQWLQLPSEQEEKLGLTFTQKGEKWQLKTMTNELSTSHEWLPIGNAEPIAITYAIVQSNGYDEYTKFTKAAIATLNELSPLQLVETSSENADWLFWFSEEAAPNRESIITIDKTQVQPWLAITKDRVSMSGDWDTEQAIAQEFPKQLLQVIAKNITTGIEEKQSMNTAVFEYRATDLSKTTQNTEAASDWLWVALLLLLVLERFVSFKSAAL